MSQNYWTKIKKEVQDITRIHFFTETHSRKHFSDAVGGLKQGDITCLLFLVQQKCHVIKLESIEKVVARIVIADGEVQ